MLDHFIFISLILFVFFSSQFDKKSGFFGKILSVLGVMIGSSMLVILTMRLSPKDPVDYILGDQATANAKVELKSNLGLTDEKGNPLAISTQYLLFTKKIITGDAKSFKTKRSVLLMLSERLPYTVALCISSMILAIIIGNFLGLLGAFVNNQIYSLGINIFSLLGIAIPNFFLGPLLIIFLAILIPIFPVSGAFLGFKSIVLPTLTLATGLSAIIARMSKTSMLAVLSEDYIRTAKSKGLSKSIIFLKHALRNALLPVVTLIGLQFGVLLTGTVITEKIFNWPGVGLLLFESIQSLDMPMVQTIILFIAFTYAVVNLLTDIVYSVIDPRI